MAIAKKIKKVAKKVVTVDGFKTTIKWVASFGVGIAAAECTKTVKTATDKRIDKSVDDGIAIAKKLYKQYRG